MDTTRRGEYQLGGASEPESGRPERSNAFVVRLVDAEARLESVVIDMPPLRAGIDALITLRTRDEVPGSAIVETLRGLADWIERRIVAVESKPWGVS